MWTQASKGYGVLLPDQTQDEVARLEAVEVLNLTEGALQPHLQALVRTAA